jgi:hypothetical protein
MVKKDFTKAVSLSNAGTSSSLSSFHLTTHTSLLSPLKRIFLLTSPLKNQWRDSLLRWPHQRPTKEAPRPSRRPPAGVCSCATSNVSDPSEGTEALLGPGSLLVISCAARTIDGLNRKHSSGTADHSRIGFARPTTSRMCSSSGWTSSVETSVRSAATSTVTVEWPPSWASVIHNTPLAFTLSSGILSRGMREHSFQYFVCPKSQGTNG